MVVVALCGLPGSGKSALAAELVAQRGFKRVVVRNQKCALSPSCSRGELDAFIEESVSRCNLDTVVFETTEEAIDALTPRWRESFVFADMPGRADYEAWLYRPFFVLVAVAAPASARLARLQASMPDMDAAQMLMRDDAAMFGPQGLIHVLPRARLTLSNGGDLGALRAFAMGMLPLDMHEKTHSADPPALPLDDDRWVRPSWDAYFMALAELAAQRANCMKRRVGAVIVSADMRVVSTGYNGTARGLANCCAGGCPRCNANARRGTALDLCLCLHAEENALLEAGRARALGGTLYCTTRPCIGCSQKIAQCGLARVVYGAEYASEHDTFGLLSAAGVVLERFSAAVPAYISLDRL